jgi:hypothetical protein
MSEATKIKLKARPKAGDGLPKKPGKTIDIGLPKGMEMEAKKTSSQQLAIRSRPIMRANGTPIEPQSDSPEPSSAPALGGSVKKIVPVSIHNGDDSVEAKEANTDAKPDDDAAPADEPSEQDDAQQNEKPAADTEPEREQASNSDEPDSSSEPSNANNPQNADDKTKQAVEAAEAQLKRESELEDLINKREYYVPINARARKRSVHISAAMILVVIILAGALIDLMLDSGMIQLPQNIPHTHFFGGNSRVVKE